MIRFPLTAGELHSQIDAAVADWRARSNDYLPKALRAGKLVKSQQIWGEIKSVFYEIQHGKCIYCERIMPELVDGSTESHVEHFRPKNRTRAWPTAAHVKRRPGISRYRARVSSGAAAGYLRLALDPLNYALSCATCNSSKKHDYFPIAGISETTATDRGTLDATERPLLLFPLGEFGPDPSSFFGYLGISLFIRPGLSDDDQLRATVTIDFFALDTRLDLLEPRAWVIATLWPELEKERSGETEELRASAKRFIERLGKPDGRHVACATDFILLYRSKLEMARIYYERARKFLESRDPKLAALLDAS